MYPHCNPVMKFINFVLNCLLWKDKFGCLWNQNLELNFIAPLSQFHVFFWVFPPFLWGSGDGFDDSEFALCCMKDQILFEHNGGVFATWIWLFSLIQKHKPEYFSLSVFQVELKMPGLFCLLWKSSNWRVKEPEKGFFFWGIFEWSFGPPYFIRWKLPCSSLFVFC